MDKSDNLSFSVFIDNQVKIHNDVQNIARNSGDLHISSCEFYKKCILPRRTCVWIDDDSVDDCYQCHTSFGWYIRRHHCRGCGRIFCYSCSKFTIQATEVTKAGLIDPEKYLSDCLQKNKAIKFYPYRSCQECTCIFEKIKKLASIIIVLELLPLEITEYYNLRRVDRMWYEACNIFLSRFREIQYNLPNHKFTSFEKKMLKNNLHLIIGHNKLICQYIKSIEWELLGLYESEYCIKLIKSTEQTCGCWCLMCCSECQKILTDTEVIDILLHVKFPKVRETVINYLTKDPSLLKCYIPILTYSIRLDDETHKKNLNFYTVREAHSGLWRRCHCCSPSPMR